MQIVDIHVHPCLDRHPVRSAQRIIRAAERSDVSRICLLGDVLRFGYDPDERHVEQINDLTIRLVDKWPEHFVGFCFLNPANSVSFVEKEMERCIVKHGMRGIKLEVGVNARDRRLDPIMRRAAQYRAPVLHHAWYKTVGKAHNESDPSDIADLAARFPGVPIIMAHLAPCGVRGVLDVKPFPNIHVDTSGSQPTCGVVEYAVKNLGAARVVYGSDAPGRDFSSQLGRIYGARIAKRERDLILGHNARRLLGL